MPISGDGDADPGEVSEEAARAQKHHEQFEQSRIEMIRGYAEVRDCSREYCSTTSGRSSTTRAGTATTARPTSS